MHLYPSVLFTLVIGIYPIVSGLSSRRQGTFIEPPLHKLDLTNDQVPLKSSEIKVLDTISRSAVCLDTEFTGAIIDKNWVCKGV